MLFSDRPSSVGILTCCGLIRAANCVWNMSDKQVTLCGWVDTYRDHSGVLFIDLRDRYGKTQVVFAPEGGRRNPAGVEIAAIGVRRAGARQGRPAARGNRQSEARHRPDRAAGRASGDPQPQPDAAVPADRQGIARRGPPAEVSLHRPSPAGDAADDAAAESHDQDHARLLRRPGLYRRRDADARPQHAGGRPRLSGAQPRSARARSTPCRSRRSSTSRF